MSGEKKMTRLEQIVLHAQKLPESLQEEVLDFVEYLEVKVLSRQPNLSDKDWSDFSLTSALTGIEESVQYTLSDLKEKEPLEK